MNIFEDKKPVRKRRWRMPDLDYLFDKYWLWAVIVMTVACAAFVWIDTDWVKVRANLNQPMTTFTKGEFIAVAVLAAFLARK